MKLLPLYPNVIIERLKPDEQIGGVYVPNSQKESLKGRVVAVYEDCTVVSVGQIVIYAQFAGDPINREFMEGKDCLLMPATNENLLAIYG